jgi:hypothetical protein
MVIDDPSKFHLLATDVKEKMIKAGIATVNIMAAKARKEAIKNISRNFITRNTFTTRQVQFTSMPVGRYSLSAIQATVGITQKASYMKRQEEGGEHTPSKGSTLAIPTDEARGGTKYNKVLIPLYKTKGRKRVHTPKKKGGGHGKNKKLFLEKVSKAYEKKLFIAMGGKGRQRNLHKITSFRKIGDKVKFKSKQIYKFTQRKTKTDANPWLLPACEKVGKEVLQIFASQMKKT